MSITEEKFYNVLDDILDAISDTMKYNREGLFNLVSNLKKGEEPGMKTRAVNDFLGHTYEASIELAATPEVESHNDGTPGIRFQWKDRSIWIPAHRLSGARAPAIIVIVKEARAARIAKEKQDKKELEDFQL